MNKQNLKLQQMQEIIIDLGMPRAQQNERTALCLLCLLDLTPDKSWNQATNPLNWHYTNHGLEQNALWEMICS